MSTYLLVDIGAGTMDVLYYDDKAGIHYKAVVKSPVRHLAQKIESTPGNLLLTGCEMGGGPVTRVLQDRTRTDGIVMSASAAATIHHDVNNVLEAGINVVSDEAAERLRDEKAYNHIILEDLQIDRLKRLITAFGVPFAFNTVGICAQDHGVPPQGVSHLDFRHNLFKEKLDRNPYPHTLIYEKSEIPSCMNRLNGIAGTAAALPADEIFVMDSGMAAILGASMDLRAVIRKNIIVLDIATSHTVGACLHDGELYGFFEYHTKDITLERLESLLPQMADGKLSHKTILQEGGHGAYTRKTMGFNAVEAIINTGPKRGLMTDTRLDLTPGAPLGDNMMTGTVGLLEAIRRRKQLDPIKYV